MQLVTSRGVEEKAVKSGVKEGLDDFRIKRIGVIWLQRISPPVFECMRALIMFLAALHC